MSVRRFRFSDLIFILISIFAIAGCGYYHTVKKGETLSSISKRYDVNIDDILEANKNIKDPNQVKVDQKIKIPREKSPSYQAVKPSNKNSENNPSEVSKNKSESKHRTASRSSEKNSKKKEATSDKKARSEKSKSKKKESKKKSDSKAGKGESKKEDNSNAKDAGAVAIEEKPNFIWPLDGPILANFGPTPDGRTNDGIDIGSIEGADILAAADGEVIASTDQFPAFGNLILIKHSGNYVTVYAHNEVNLVVKGDKVKKGQVIAKVGQTGRATSPRLHFEIRILKNPTDPLRQLPPKSAK